MKTALLIVALALTGCTSGGSGSATSGPAAISKYTQTWSKPYASTTCDEWNSAMTAHQQFAAAADMLTGARNNGDGGSGLPPDLLVIGFELDISKACSLPATSATQLLAETAATVYLVGRAQYRP
jgi:hypothetical protein